MLNEIESILLGSVEVLHQETPFPKDEDGMDDSNSSLPQKLVWRYPLRGKRRFSLNHLTIWQRRTKTRQESGSLGKNKLGKNGIKPRFIMDHMTRMNFKRLLRNILHWPRSFG